jgi:hypothetical protein
MLRFRRWRVPGGMTRHGSEPFIMEDELMRELIVEEFTCIAGGDGDYECTPVMADNVYYGVSNPNDLGNDLIDIYEGFVMATSHVIERVANALP